mmetsp:Transcript_46317/g.140308  ORF Transcript_46317/g.140308 Transcript_46317/m.140308 type:complete len:210 (+) Transcript_46317:656-1285(+)
MTYRLASASGNGTYMRRENRRRTASSTSQGQLVHPSTSTRRETSSSSSLLAGPASNEDRLPLEPPDATIPSIWTMNSVLNLRLASCSSSFLRLSNASNSSKNSIDGATSSAIRNRVLTNFSPSPCHLEVREEDVAAKRTQQDSFATAFTSMVLPVPGGPYSRIPRGAVLSPVYRSGRRRGKIAASCMLCLASRNPAISPHDVVIVEEST